MAQLLIAIIFFTILYFIWKWYRRATLTEDVKAAVEDIQDRAKAADRIPSDLKKRSTASKKKLDGLKDLSQK